MKYLMMVILAFSFSAMAENIAVEIVTPIKVEAVKPAEILVVVPIAIKTVDEVKLTVKDEAFVPPDWIQDALLNLKSIPVIGPPLVQVFQWLGVLASVVTALFSFLWVVLKSLEGVLGAAKLYELANKMVMLQNSKFMYYLKAFSMFNAQKKDKPV